MNRFVKIFLLIFVIFSFSSCNQLFRDYNDEELRNLALTNYGFSEFKVFKIVDLDTAHYMTGNNYQNSGVIIGVKDGENKMLFVPRKTSEPPYFVMDSFAFNLDDIYQKLYSLEDDSGNEIFNDPSGDYGGLSISIIPYNNLTNNNPSLSFDSEIIFIFTSDTETQYVGIVEGVIFVFNEGYEVIS
jgi:hypothetical protein